MDWVAIGGRIRKQREYLGLTREQFAEKLDITPKFCADIELGTKGMSVPTLCRIATTLSLSTDYILFGKQEKNDKPRDAQSTFSDGGECNTRAASVSGIHTENGYQCHES